MILRSNTDDETSWDGLSMKTELQNTLNELRKKLPIDLPKKTTIVNALGQELVDRGLLSKMDLAINRDALEVYTDNILVNRSDNGLLTKWKIKWFLKKTLSGPGNRLGIGIHYRELEPFIIFAYSEKLNPYEAILYAITCYIASGNNYDDMGLLAYSIGKESYESTIETVNRWRNSALIRYEVYSDFIRALDYTTKRWPDLFSKNGAQEEEWYEVHRTRTVSGSHDPQVASTGEDGDPNFKIFETCYDAASYISETSNQELWWFYGSTTWIFQENNRAQWRPMPPPNALTKESIDVFYNIETGRGKPEDIYCAHACSRSEFVMLKKSAKLRFGEHKPVIWHLLYKCVERPVDNLTC